MTSQPPRERALVYEQWLPGRAPWEIPIADAPEWLLEEIEKLVEAHGGVSQSGRTRTLSTGGDDQCLRWSMRMVAKST